MRPSNPHHRRDRAALPRILTLIVGLVLPTTAQLAAQVIDYRISVYTKPGGGNGTDNNIYVKLYGSKGKWTSEFELQGDHENGDTDAFTHRNVDIGVITKISIDVSGSLDDEWTPYSISILRGTNRDDRSSADGWSEFVIDRELDYDSKVFAATKIVNPRVTVSPSGKVAHHTERLTLVQFANNPHATADQLVMRYKETWSAVDRLAISTSEESSIGAHVTAKYESPETVVGQFGAEAGVTWNTTVANIRSDEVEKISQREFNWEFLAPANSAVFRLQEFEVPYADQVYRSSDGRHARIVRKLASEIVPSGNGDFLFIPKMEDGRLVPILWSELEENWLRHMDPADQQGIKDRHLNNWFAKGWVVRELAVVPAPTPIPSPAPAPTPIPQPQPEPAAAEERPQAPPQEVTLPSGLRYIDLQLGQGPEAQRGDMVEMLYTGWLTNNTRIVFNRIRFQLDSGQMIKGVDEGVLGMKRGGKRKLFIPSELGYGKDGAAGVIPPNADLVFEIELEGIGGG